MRKVKAASLPITFQILNLIGHAGPSSAEDAAAGQALSGAYQEAIISSRWAKKARNFTGTAGRVINHRTHINLTSFSTAFYLRHLHRHLWVYRLCRLATKNIMRR